jgi:hypothetical protein
MTPSKAGRREVGRLFRTSKGDHSEVTTIRIPRKVEDHPSDGMTASHTSVQSRLAGVGPRAYISLGSTPERSQ